MHVVGEWGYEKYRDWTKYDVHLRTCDQPAVRVRVPECSPRLKNWPTADLNDDLDPAETYSFLYSLDSKFSQKSNKKSP